MSKKNCLGNKKSTETFRDLEVGHESIINNYDPICNKCLLDEQTPWHLLTECPATLKIRKEIPPGKWTTSIILKAIKSIDYLEVSLNSQNTQLTINIT
jgi:hypothetical protein